MCALQGANLSNLTREEWQARVNANRERLEERREEMKREREKQLAPKREELRLDREERLGPKREEIKRDRRERIEPKREELERNKQQNMRSGTDDKTDRRDLEQDPAVLTWIRWRFVGAILVLSAPRLATSATNAEQATQPQH